jgi:hypothetical protein
MSDLESCFLICPSADSVYKWYQSPYFIYTMLLNSRGGVWGVAKTEIQPYLS